MGVLDWEYYNSHFPKISEDEFNKYSYGAERKVMKKLNKPFEEYSENEQTDIKDCICNVLNYQSVINKTNGISSVSNDGYSESYVQKEESQAEDDLNSIINEWIGHLIVYYLAF